MSVNFSLGTNAYVRNDAAAIQAGGYPLAVGFWVMPTTTGSAKRFWACCNPAANNESFVMGQTSTDAWSQTVTDSGGTAARNIGTVTVGQWAFLLGRFVSSTLRLLDVLQFDGSIVADSNIANRSPGSSLSRMSVGALADATPDGFYNGLLGELWYCGSQIPTALGSAAAVNPDVLRSLAYGGPLSVPSVASCLTEYRSFRSDPSGNYGSVARGISSPIWTPVGGPGIGQHPPLRFAS